MPKCLACESNFKHEFVDDSPTPCPQCGKPVDSPRLQSWKSVSQASIAAPFIALLVGCGVNFLVNSPGSTGTEPDRATKLIVGLIPFAVALAGIAAGVAAFIVAGKRNYRGIKVQSIIGIVLNVAFIGFLIFLVAAAIQALESVSR